MSENSAIEDYFAGVLLKDMLLIFYFNSARPVPLGMESRAILDSWITASSEASSNFRPQLARLHQTNTFGGASGWCSYSNNYDQWLQVDLQIKTRVTGIATQGRGDYLQWVKNYKLQYGDDGHTFTFYRRIGDHSDTVWKSSLVRDTSFNVV